MNPLAKTKVHSKSSNNNSSAQHGAGRQCSTCRGCKEVVCTVATTAPFTVRFPISQLGCNHGHGRGGLHALADKRDHDAIGVDGDVAGCLLAQLQRVRHVVQVSNVREQGAQNCLVAHLRLQQQHHARQRQ